MATRSACCRGSPRPIGARYPSNTEGFCSSLPKSRNSTTSPTKSAKCHGIPLTSNPFKSNKIMAIQLRDKATCHYDQISLGEIMLRLDPGEGRVRTARQFTAWEGGGEYNTSRGLRKCFGYRTAVCTAFVDNEVGHLIEDFIMQGGVDTDFIKWREDDGIGRTVRNGLNFTERGFGIRGAVGNPDRGNTAASQLKPC